MNSKKGIILLITLFFISAISVLILQNLDDTNKYIDESNSQNTISQIQITIQNIIDEVPKYLKGKSNDELDKIIENTENGIPFPIGNIDIILSINEVEIPLFNVNKLTPELMNSNEFVESINNGYDFKKIVDSHMENNNTYTNQKQIDQIMDEYIKLTRDERALGFKENFTFIERNNKTRFFKCDCTITIDNTSTKISFVFNLAEPTKLLSFNII